jgi:hypothetical protein
VPANLIDIGNSVMNYRKLSIAIGLTIIVSNKVALSATPLDVPGLGKTSCSETVELQADDTKRLELTAWMQGALTGLMIAHGRQYMSELTEVEGTPLLITYDSSGDWVWLVEYCRENENDNVAQAMMERWKEIAES